MIFDDERQIFQLGQHVRLGIAEFRPLSFQIRSIVTKGCYKIYSTYYCIILRQQRQSAVGTCIITMSQPPPSDISSASGFFIEIIRNDEDIRHAAKLIAFKLEIDKPLYLHLALSDFEEETIMEVINEVLKS
ncbi:hypothetical protein ILUMI_18910 [Ignelater luminosus]|uniref:Uncharacterized protein n=1 Tax=Ignelater luminosus TaxID=2038154 RepID=A0A8K0G6D9_IGNLU|nr:hypothetical protein ILUMI_18910 [Ignelater luminosus]